MKIDSMKIIKDFLETNNILNDPNFLGVYFYGSCSTNTNNEYSDLDILIVYKQLEKEVRCIYNYKDLIYIEYFKRSIDKLYKRVDNSYEKRIDDVLPIIGYSKILYTKDDSLEKLQTYTKNKFKKPYKELNKEDVIYELYKTYKSIENLINMNSKNDISANAYSQIVLEKIRKTYHSFFGKSKISPCKVYEIYNNKDIREAQKREIPNQDFIDIYNKIVIENDINKKIELLKELYLILVNWYYKKYLKKIKNERFDLNLFLNKEIDLRGREY